MIDELLVACREAVPGVAWSAIRATWLDDDRPSARVGVRALVPGAEARVWWRPANDDHPAGYVADIGVIGAAWGAWRRWPDVRTAMLEVASSMRGAGDDRGGYYWRPVGDALAELLQVGA
jgi:hypothetical protein